MLMNGEMLSYEELDIEKYRFIATLDKRTCMHCAKLDNQVFSVKDRKLGKNFPPLHPLDRCSTVAEFDDDVTEGLQRRARDEDGKSILVPQDMSYNEWKKEYVNNVSTNIKNNGIIPQNEEKEEETLLYSDITEKMYKNAKPKEGKVINQDFFEYDGKKYYIDEHNVVYNHDDREIEVAKLLNEIFGGDVKILPNINYPQGIKSPDYIFRKENLDLKRITSKRANDCVKTAIRDGKRQAQNFIIDNTAQTVSDEAILKQIDEIYNSGKFSWVNTIYVLKDKSFIKIYTRK